MPPPKAPAVDATETQPEIEVSTTPLEINDSLEKLLDSLKVTETVRAQVASGDLTSLQPRDADKVCAWYALTCGLHPSEVCTVKVKGDSGKVIPYVKASGVMRFARGKFKRLTRDAPQFVNNNRTVIVFATVEMSDGSSVTDFASRDATDARSLMACSTAASVRVLRIACGIPIPSEGEVQ
jgi:hypothetical protein